MAEQKKVMVFIPANNKDDIAREINLGVNRWYSIPTNKMTPVPLDVAEMLKRIGYISDYTEID